MRLQQEHLACQTDPADTESASREGNLASLEAWRFLDDDGSFILPGAEAFSAAYFPLVNPAGMMSCVTPELQGDAKIGQHAFLLAPATVEDLHHARYGRNFWLHIDGLGPWSATGNSARQRARRFSSAPPEHHEVQAGLLWHRITRTNPAQGIRAEITTFVPARGRHVELMEVRIINVGAEALTFTPTAAIPIYARSADNIRDHRHVSSLLHRIHTGPHGVVVTPRLSFDARGHTVNSLAYAVWGSGGDGDPVVALFPTVHDFVGPGGSLDWPAAVVTNQPGQLPGAPVAHGQEALGGLQFARRTLQPGEQATYRVVLSIHPAGGHAPDMVYLEEHAFGEAFQQTCAFWRTHLDRLRFDTADHDFDRWVRWVALQPTLRRICGCSFLPYHDYGRGGRGWRDLWQDCLGLLVRSEQDVRNLLLDNFAGVRFDGSNATIIGSEVGQFVADRNNVSRAWMDHGAWPLITTSLYLDLSGDLQFLLEPQVYYRDQHIRRCRGRDPQCQSAEGGVLLIADGTPHRGSVIEHLIVQNVTAFFNVGDHNHIRLENGDWNDAFDSAAERGESVAFTALYGANLLTLSRLLEALAARCKVSTLRFAVEIMPLLDTLGQPVDYDDPRARQQCLERFWDTFVPHLSGRTVDLPIDRVAADLARKGNCLLHHIRHSEWIADPQGGGWFNGYYDNHGRALEHAGSDGARMTLTGQVFTIMSGAADEDQVRQILTAADRYLWDDAVGGYRLNTDFGDQPPDIGYCFSFAFGHKENGAMFSHMAVMFAHALYARGLAHQGHRILDRIYRHCMDFKTSRTLPGIPEYVNDQGRGMYPYLTGSASWYIFTLLTRVFGVSGSLGDLSLQPALLAGQFDEDGEARVTTIFAERRLRITYRNPERQDYPDYAVVGATLDGAAVALTSGSRGAVIPRQVIADLAEDEVHELIVELG